MGWTTFWMIMAIVFWVLLALTVVGFMAWIYTQVQYYKWDKEDRQFEKMKEYIEQAIKSETDGNEADIDKS